jgi:dipeptidyl aminopeptidase/acylaminoacyl peptidase
MNRIVFILIAAISLTGCGEAAETIVDESPIDSVNAVAEAVKPQVVDFLNVQGLIEPTISPDGEKAAFTSSASGTYQIWMAEVAGATGMRQLTDGNSVTFHKWSPSGKGIIYGVDKEGDEKEGFYFLSPEDSVDVELLSPSDAYRFFGELNSTGTKFCYSTTERNGTDFDIHVYDIEQKQDHKIFEGKLGYYPVSFSPTEQHIVIHEQLSDNANNLYLLNVLTQELEQLNDQGSEALYEDIRWAKDGSGLYLRTDWQKEFTGVCYYDLASKKMDYVIEHDFDVEQILFSPTDQMLHYVANENGYSKHHVLNTVSDIEIGAPEWPKGIIELRISKDGVNLIALVQSPQMSGAIWHWNIKEEKLTRVTAAPSGNLKMASMVLPEAHSFNARDGLQIHGLLYEPTNVGENKPLIIRVHGGPTHQARPRFLPMVQYFVSRGFAVFDLNYRGSTGYGKSYANANNFRKRADELYDLEDAALYLQKKGVVDSNRIGIMGGSYGGYLAMAAMTRLPGTFNCAVSVVGVSNWITALEGASPNLKAGDRLEYGDVENEEDRAFFKSISPIKYVDRIEGPMLIVHGANDPRNPVSESDTFVNSIQSHGGVVEYLRFEDEGHSIRKIENRIEMAEKVAAFFSANLK